MVRLLDDWWSRLGKRLAEKERQLALPDAPPAAIEAASALWVAAMEHAKAWAAEVYGSERAALEAERTQFEEARTSAAERQLLADKRAIDAKAAEEQAARRVRDLAGWS
jgi:hypothetical protein